MPWGASAGDTESPKYSAAGGVSTPGGKPVRLVPGETPMLAPGDHGVTGVRHSSRTKNREVRCRSQSEADTAGIKIVISHHASLRAKTGEACAVDHEIVDTVRSLMRTSTLPESSWHQRSRRGSCPRTNPHRDPVSCGDARP